MDLTTTIVDLLRAIPENRALRKGGPTAGASPEIELMLRKRALQHNGRSPMQIAEEAETGRASSLDY